MEKEETKTRKIICTNKECKKKGKGQPEENFYNCKIEGVDKFPLCKSCIKELVDPNDLDSVLKILKSMNLPFYAQVWDGAMELSPTNPFGTYISKVSTLTQYRNKTWEDGEVLDVKPKIEQKTNVVMTAPKFSKEDEEQFSDTKREEALRLFGPFPEDVLKMMYDKYNLLKDAYPSGPLYQESLTTYVRYKVQEDIAVMNGDVDAAESWSKMAQKQAEQAKLTPKQLKEQDLEGDLSSIAMLSLMVEENIDVVPLMPKFQPGPRDLPDFLIYCLTERMREELGLPPCSYEDIYKWYDKLVEAYVSKDGDPSGILNDPIENMREVAKKFLEECQDV